MDVVDCFIEVVVWKSCGLAVGRLFTIHEFGENISRRLTRRQQMMAFLKTGSNSWSMDGRLKQGVVCIEEKTIVGCWIFIYADGERVPDAVTAGEEFIVPLS